MAETGTRAFGFAFCVFLVFAWCAGGPTVDGSAKDEWIQLAALPVLVLSLLLVIRGAHREETLPLWPMWVALLVAVVPLLQLLPLPGVLMGSGARATLAQDLAAAGVQPGSAWSLIPVATERSLWALLPALAGFLGALALAGSRTAARRIVQLLLLLIVANIGFGLFQAGLPPASPLRLYPGWGNGFGGVLVSVNHQATALIIGMLLSLGLWARTRAHRQSPWWQRLVYPLIALVCLFAIPLTGSRAGMVLALAMLVLGGAAVGLIPVLRMRRSRRARWAAAGASLLLVVSCLSAWSWMRVDAKQESRQAIALETARLGGQHAPLGSGIGTFVPVFEQEAAPRFLISEYVNHAHNEYAQWWLTGGVPAMLALLAVLGMLGWTGMRLLRQSRPEPVAMACWMGCVAVALHSLVDFPLRTLSLMSVTAVLAGLSVAAATTGSRSRGYPPRREQPA